MGKVRWRSPKEESSPLPSPVFQGESWALPTGFQPGVDSSPIVLLTNLFIKHLNCFKFFIIQIVF